MSADWKTRRERSTVGAILLIVWIALHLGRRIARLILLPVTLYFFLVAGEARRASLRFLRHTLGPGAGHLDVFRNIYSFAACALDRVYLLSGRHDALDLSLPDADEALAVPRSGRGCLMLSAHLGSFEVCRVLGSVMHGPRFRIVMDVAHGGKIMSVLSRLNPALAANIINSGAAGPALALRIKQALDEGCIVGMMADRVTAADTGIAVDVLGRRALLPSTPLKLAAAVGAPTLLAFGLYRGANRYELRFETFLDGSVVPRAERERWLPEAQQAFADRLSFHAANAPYNWFNFYDFWTDAPAAA